MRTLCALVLAASLTVACSDNPPVGEPPTTTTVTETPTDSPASMPCAEEISQGERLEGTLEGDVDGDGSVDEVFLVQNEGSAAECRNLLVVEGDGVTYAASTDDPAMPYSLPQPRLNRLAHVDEVGGAEVLVDVEAGAATQFLAMFTVEGGELERVRMPGDAGLSDLFPYGGSVGHVEASNCPTDDTADVVVSIATPRGARYLVERRFYRLDGASLIEGERTVERLRIESLAQEHDYVTSPFGGCAVTP